MYNVTRNKFTYFTSHHINSTSHKEWISHKNTATNNLENKPNKELVEQIEELQRQNRKDKVDFRGYLSILEKESLKDISSLKEKLEIQEQRIAELKDHKKKLEKSICNPPTGDLLELS